MWDYIDVCNEGDVDAKWLTEADHDRIVAEAEARGWNAALDEVGSARVRTLDPSLLDVLVALLKPEVEG